MAKALTDVNAQANVELLSNLGLQSVACLTVAEQKALGELTLNELRTLIKAQQLLPRDTVSNICGGSIF